MKVGHALSFPHDILLEMIKIYFNGVISTYLVASHMSPLRIWYVQTTRSVRAQQLRVAGQHFRSNPSTDLGRNPRVEVHIRPQILKSGRSTSLGLALL